MQLPQTADVLVPLGVGAVVVIIALVVLIVRAFRRRSPGAVVAEPTASDWTGATASGAPLAGGQAMASAEPPTSQNVPRDELPVELDALMGGAVGAPRSVPVPGPREPSTMGLAEAAALPLFAGPGGGAGPVGEPRPSAVPAPEATPAAPAEMDRKGDDRMDRSGEPREDAGAAETAPLHDFAAPQPALDEPADLPRPAPSRSPAAASGSSRTVAAAVAQALAVRAAAARAQGGAPQSRSGPVPGPASVPTSAPRGDARDRLLAVLLNDPVRAVGATVELEACRSQLERLTDAVNHERGRLGEVLAKLATAGLRPDQLARLSGLPTDEVHELLGGAQRSA